MKQPKPYLIVTFHTTAAAMAMEKHCAAAGISGKLIPIPRALSADCGIAWRCAPEARSAVEQLLRQQPLETEGLYELTL